MEIERAKAFAEVTQVIISLAKVEHLLVGGGKATGLINAPGTEMHRLSE